MCTRDERENGKEFGNTRSLKGARNPSRGLLIVESMAILYGSTPTIISLRLESEGAKRGPRALTGTQCKVLCLAIRLRGPIPIGEGV